MLDRVSTTQPFLNRNWDIQSQEEIKQTIQGMRIEDIMELCGSMVEKTSQINRKTSWAFQQDLLKKQEQSHLQKQKSYISYGQIGATTLGIAASVLSLAPGSVASIGGPFSTISLEAIRKAFEIASQGFQATGSLADRATESKRDGFGYDINGKEKMANMYYENSQKSQQNRREASDSMQKAWSAKQETFRSLFAN